MNACRDAYVGAQKLRKDHKLLAARDDLHICAQSTCADFIVKECARWLDMVQESLSAVVPVVIDEDGTLLSDVKVSIDEQDLAPAIDGRSIEVDPGPHVFTFETHDGRKAAKSVLVPEGDKWVRVVVTLDAPPAPPAPNPEAPPVTSAALPASAPSSVSPPAMTSVQAPLARETRAVGPWKEIGIALTSVGVLGLGVGAAFGVDALSKRNASQCDSPSTCPSADAANEWNAAGRSARVSTGFIIAGGVFAASGMALWILAPRHSIRVAASLAPESTTLVLSTSF